MQKSYKLPIVGFDSHLSYMEEQINGVTEGQGPGGGGGYSFIGTNHYIYPQTTQRVKRTNTRTSKTYDDNGQLICEETEETVEYEDQGYTWPVSNT